MPASFLRLPFDLIALVSALVLSGAAQAQPASAPAAIKTSALAGGGPSWSALTPAQRQILAPLERDWQTIDNSRRTKWLEIAARFPKMPPDEQKRVQDRMTEWARLSPAERGRARLSFQEAKQLTPKQRQEKWEAYQALPDSERRALAARAAASRPASPSSSVAASLVPTPKQNVAASKSPTSLVQSVAPTVVQAKPGATTTLIGKGSLPPAHQRPGQPKIAAKPGQVDRATLLPKAETAKPSSPAASGAADTQS